MTPEKRCVTRASFPTRATHDRRTNLVTIEGSDRVSVGGTAYDLMVQGYRLVGEMLRPGAVTVFIERRGFPVPSMVGAWRTVLRAP